MDRRQKLNDSLSRLKNKLFIISVNSLHIAHFTLSLEVKNNKNMKNFSILNCFVLVIAFSTSHASVSVSLLKKLGLLQANRPAACTVAKY